jgi:hypothetical protein
MTLGKQLLSKAAYEVHPTEEVVYRDGRNKVKPVGKPPFVQYDHSFPHISCLLCSSLSSSPYQIDEYKGGNSFGEA